MSRAYDEGRAAERILVAATLLGIGGGISWVRGDVRDAVRAILGVPGDRLVRTIVALGHPTDAARRPASAPGPGEPPTRADSHRRALAGLTRSGLADTVRPGWRGPAAARLSTKTAGSRPAVQCSVLHGGGTRWPRPPYLPALVSVLLTPDVGRKARLSVPTMGSAGCGSRAPRSPRLRALCTFVAVVIVASCLAITLHAALDRTTLLPTGAEGKPRRVADPLPGRSRAPSHGPLGACPSATSSPEQPPDACPPECPADDPVAGTPGHAARVTGGEDRQVVGHACRPVQLRDRATPPCHASASPTKVTASALRPARSASSASMSARRRPASAVRSSPMTSPTLSQ